MNSGRIKRLANSQNKSSKFPLSVNPFLINSLMTIEIASFTNSFSELNSWMVMDQSTPKYPISHSQIFPNFALKTH